MPTTHLSPARPFDPQVTNLDRMTMSTGRSRTATRGAGCRGGTGAADKHLPRGQQGTVPGCTAGPGSWICREACPPALQWQPRRAMLTQKKTGSFSTDFRLLWASEECVCVCAKASWRQPGLYGGRGARRGGNSPRTFCVNVLNVAIGEATPRRSSKLSAVI